MDSSEVSFPNKIAWTVVALSVLPILLLYAFAGVAFPIDYESTPIRSELFPEALFHTILEWTAICVALCTVAFAFSHFSVKHDLISPVIGTALFFSAMIDAFQLLAVDGLMMLVRDRAGFIPISWAMSRTFYICLLIAGTAPFTARPQPIARFTSAKGTQYIILTGVLFVAMAYAIISILSSASELPATLPSHWKFLLYFPIPRPWDLLPLGLFLLAGGIVFPRFDKVNPSLFSKSLIVSVVPNAAAQMHMAFGSTKEYDENLFIALYLKLLAYLVPLVGLILDYTRAYGVEVTLRMTEEKLRVARRVQQGLLPKSAPEVPGFDLAGRSYPAEVVGGDYFDFIPMDRGRLGIVVADVSGHEIGASILMAQTRAYLRALTLSLQNIGPLISQVNRFLSKDVQDRWFVTLFYIGLNPSQHNFEYVAAGHECYLFNAAGEAKALESTSPPLGVLEDGEIACGPEVAIEPGGILLLMTDGIIETPAPSGEHFGLERIFAIVKTNRHRTAREIVDTLHTASEAYRATRRREDDVTVVVLKRDATA